MNIPTTESLEKIVVEKGLDNGKNIKEGNYLFGWRIALQQALKGAIRIYEKGDTQPYKSAKNSRENALKVFAAYTFAHQASVHPSRKTVTRRAASSDTGTANRSPAHNQEKCLIHTVLSKTEIWLPDALTPQALASGYREAFHHLMVVGNQAAVATHDAALPTSELEDAITNLLQVHEGSRAGGDSEAMDSIARIRIMDGECRTAIFDLIKIFVEEEASSND